LSHTVLLFPFIFKDVQYVDNSVLVGVMKQN